MPVTHVAAALVLGKAGWTATELDLTGAADIEEVADRMRDVDPAADVSLLFVEADDIYLVILRLDAGEDLRVFGSDSAFAHESRLGSLLLGDIEVPALEIDAALAEAEAEAETEVEAGADPDGGPEVPPPSAADPVGDADLLADLGMSAHRLLTTCAQDGMLPADITAEVAKHLGCADELEELREA